MVANRKQVLQHQEVLGTNCASEARLALGGRLTPSPFHLSPLYLLPDSGRNHVHAFPQCPDGNLTLGEGSRPCWHPPEVAGLESAPLSGWSRNAPTSQNTSAHRPGDLNELCGGGEGTMQGTGSEAKGKWPGGGAGNPGHVST